MPLLLTVLYIGALGILAHYIGEALPRRWFRFRAFPFQPFWCEKSGRLYHFLRVRQWKDHLPDMSRIMRDMVPKRLSGRPTSQQLYALVRETCVAETVHRVLGILFLGIYFFYKNTDGIIVTLLTLLLNLPYIIIQRYNRPKLLKLADKMAEKERKQQCVS